MKMEPRYWWCTKGTSDKVYAVFYTNDGGIAVWGGRQGALRCMFYDSATLAKKVAERSAHGYVDISSKNTAEAIDIRQKVNVCIKQYTKINLDTHEPVVAAPAPKTTKPVVSPDNPGIVICVNNIGMEDKFTNGIDYLLKSIEKDFFVVEDMLGVDQKVMQSRFQIDKNQTRHI